MKRRGRCGPRRLQLEEAVAALRARDPEKLEELLGEGLVWKNEFWDLLLFSSGCDGRGGGVNWVAWGYDMGLSSPTTRQRLLLHKVRTGDTAKAAYWASARPPYQEPYWPEEPYHPEEADYEAYEFFVQRGSTPGKLQAWKEESYDEHYMEWQIEDCIHDSVQDELDAEVAELERCQAQFEAQCCSEA